MHTIVNTENQFGAVFWNILAQTYISSKNWLLNKKHISDNQLNSFFYDTGNQWSIVCWHPSRNKMCFIIIHSNCSHPTYTFEVMLSSQNMLIQRLSKGKLKFYSPMTNMHEKISKVFCAECVGFFHFNCLW